MTEELEHCILPPDRITEAAALAAAAFDDSPIYNIICGPTCESEFRQNFLQWLFEHNFPGMLKGFLRFGFGVTKRLVTIKEKYECIEDIVLKKNKYKPIYRLERMVVHPKHQGKGIGSIALKKHALKDADDKDLQVMLSTQELRNVRFYERLGFKVVHTSILAGHTNWVMTRNRKSMSSTT